MPVILDKPFDVGEVGDDYTHLKITQMQINLQAGVAILFVELGIESKGVFQKGVVGGLTAEMTGQDFVNAVTSESLPNETLEDHIKRKGYEYIIAKNPRYKGRIV